MSVRWCAFIHLFKACEHDLSIFEVLCDTSTKLMNRNTSWIEWERMGEEVERAQAQSVQICLDHKLIKCYKNDSKSMITNAVLQGLRISSLTLYHSSHQGSSCDPMTVAQQTVLASSPACALARLPRVWSWQKLSGPHPWLVRPNVLDEEMEWDLRCQMS